MFFPSLIVWVSVLLGLHFVCVCVWFHFQLLSSVIFFSFLKLCNCNFVCHRIFLPLKLSVVIYSLFIQTSTPKNVRRAVGRIVGFSLLSCGLRYFLFYFFFWMTWLLFFLNLNFADLYLFPFLLSFLLTLVTFSVVHFALIGWFCIRFVFGVFPPFWEVVG